MQPLICQPNIFLFSALAVQLPKDIRLKSPSNVIEIFVTQSNDIFADSLEILGIRWNSLEVHSRD